MAVKAFRNQTLEVRLIELVKEYGVGAVSAATGKLVSELSIPENVIAFKGMEEIKKEKIVNRLLEHANKLRW